MPDESSVRFMQTVPILRIFDEQLAREFYCDFLGFEVQWEHRFEPDLPLYMEVARGGMTLHLSGHHGDCCPGSTIFVWMTGIEAFHAEIASKRYPKCRPSIEDTFYDARCLNVVDPFGNRIRFNERTSD